MADMSSEAMNVRFLVNTRTQHILFAEAGKEFVDLLFSFLSMPISSVLKLLHELESSRRVGSVSNLYDSMEKLPSQFMSTDKSQVLDPKFVTPYSNNPLRIQGRNYYVCSYPSHTNTTHNISTRRQDICICGNPINRLVQPPQNSGYVKETITFIINDDLKIRGSSTITTIKLLNQLNIKDLTDLEEWTAIVDRNKSLELLEASLVSTTVLNDVFGPVFSVSVKASVAE